MNRVSIEMYSSLVTVTTGGTSAVLLQQRPKHDRSLLIWPAEGWLFKAPSDSEWEGGEQRKCHHDGEGCGGSL